MMSGIAANWRRIESELSGLDRTAMFSEGALHADIQVDSHGVTVSTMDDAEAVRDYVEANTPLRFHGCHPQDDGHIVTFTVGRDA